jgi:uncharacterized protein YdeI (YjbR/CyaY-like superfamily)
MPAEVHRAQAKIAHEDSVSSQALVCDRHLSGVGKTSWNHNKKTSGGCFRLLFKYDVLANQLDSVKNAAKADKKLPVISFEDQQAWADWLKSRHVTSRGVWVQFAKKGSKRRSVSYSEAVEVALCYGWIDGQNKSHDESTWLQKFTPRGTRSIWSKINREKAQALIREGRMQPAGLAEIERARQDGRWEAAYDSPSTAAVPDELQAALDNTPEACAFFAALDSRNRFAILFRIHTAKRPETRTRRIAQFMRMLERHEKLYP